MNEEEMAPLWVGLPIEDAYDILVKVCQAMSDETPPTLDEFRACFDTQDEEAVLVVNIIRAARGLEPVIWPLGP